MVRAHRNISFAAADSFDAVLREGAVVTVDGKETRELRNQITQLTRPCERCVFLPGRGHDVFAQVAETLWVIAGRNDVPWLTRYLRRAPRYSDDGGQTWRGGYGPRLRSWATGIDQISNWRDLLTADRNGRRTVGILFDPDRDFVVSRDIPCNNWLSWLIRDGKLHLNVAIRSNDAVWGFSGVNAFEWSVLQEMMAHWVGAKVGDATFFATSYHIYADYYERASKVVQRFHDVTPYDFGIASSPFSTPWAAFDFTLKDWFDAEAAIFVNPNDLLSERPAMRDPFLASALRLVRLKWGAETWSEDRLAAELAALPEDDFATAAYDFFSRKLPRLLDSIPQPGIAAFFQACRAVDSVGDAIRLRAAIKSLHARKNASYAHSWKRRGERISVLPNIARKVDRLQAFADGGLILKGESLVDTAVDLYVYAVKYRLYLAEQMNANTSLLPKGASHPFSDHDQNFDCLVNLATFGQGLPELGSCIDSISSLFERMWPAAEAAAPIAARQNMAADLSLAAEHLIGHLKKSDPRGFAAFIAQELTQ